MKGCRMQEKVYALFEQLKIPYRKIIHPPTFTRADSEKRGVIIDGTVFKNLFLRNKDKSRYYLVSLPLDKQADLHALQQQLSESRLSFGEEGALAEKLHIKPGSVSFLNIIEAEESDVIFIVDREAFLHENIGVHPNDNTATILFSPNDIAKIFEHYGVTYEFLEL
jgi:Ala-tRNA(Pro) deacylase